MAKFEFRLASLLRLRESVRDQRRAALAEAYRVDELLQQRLAQIARELGWLRERARRAAGPGHIDVDQLLEAQRYELALRAEERQFQRQRAAVAAEIERRRQALVEADREVRTLEKLREKQWQAWQSEENRRQTRQLDEMAQQRFLREEVEC